MLKAIALATVATLATVGAAQAGPSITAVDFGTISALTACPWYAEMDPDKVAPMSVALKIPNGGEGALGFNLGRAFGMDYNAMKPAVLKSVCDYYAPFAEQLK